MNESFLLVLVLCLSLTPAATYAQDIQTKGSLTGTITDANGATIPNLTLAAKALEIIEGLYSGSSFTSAALR